MIPIDTLLKKMSFVTVDKSELQRRGKSAVNCRCQFSLNLGFTERHAPIEVFLKQPSFFDPMETKVDGRFLPLNWKKDQKIELQKKSVFFTDLWTFNFFRLFFGQSKSFFHFLWKILRNAKLLQLSQKWVNFKKNRAFSSKNPKFCGKIFFVLKHKIGLTGI